MYNEEENDLMKVYVGTLYSAALSSMVGRM
jgi:hypothetical protein